MITLRKLSSLPEGTRRRKIVLLVRDFENTVISGHEINSPYLREFMELVSLDDFWSGSIQEMAACINPNDEQLRRKLNALRHAMLVALGQNWADWDMETVRDKDVSDLSCVFSPVRVYLDGVRSPFNAGSIMRTSLAFGVEKIWFSRDGTSPDHPRVKRSAMGATDRIAFAIRDLEELPHAQTGTVFALELGGENIADFTFPTSGTVIIGSEESGVSPGAMQRAKIDGGVVRIPLPGPKTTLNVGVAFGILLQQWVDSLH